MSQGQLCSLGLPRGRRQPAPACLVPRLAAQPLLPAVAFLPLPGARGGCQLSSALATEVPLPPLV